MSTAPLDAFLLYNGAEPLISIIDDRLMKRGISTWFSERNLRGTGAGSATFESESTPREQEVLDQARVAVVFLGAAGWGSTHQQNTTHAVKQQKPLIRVLVGEPSAEAREFLGLFREKPVLEIRSANDEGALDALAQAIRDGKEPERTVFSNQPLRAKPRVDAERFRRALVEGEWDDQQEALDELAVIRKTHDLSALAGVVLQILPAYAPTSPNSPPSRIGAVLLAALVYTYDPARADATTITSLLAQHANMQTQPDASVRWEVRAAMLRGGPEQFPVDWTGDPDGTVNALCIRHNDPVLFESMLRSHLQSQQWVTAAPFLSAFAVAPMPGLVPDICATIWVGDSHTRNVFLALTQPEVVAAAAAQLQTLPGSEKAAELAVPVASGAGRYLTGRLASLLSRLEQPRVQAVLTRANSLPLLQALAEAGGRLRIAGYSSDTTTNRTDALGIQTEVQTLCAVMLSTDVEPPLSIGLFGDWGSGKSFFIDRMYEEVRRMASVTPPAGVRAKFHSRVAQIKFNAWHYIDSNLWASLVSHIIEELAKQVKPQEDSAVTRKELVSKLETAKELRDEAVQEKKRAEDARTTAEKQLSAVTTNRAERQVELEDLRATDYWKLVQGDPELQKALQSASRELGLPKVMASFDDLQNALLDAHSVMGRAKALAASILKRPLLLVLMAVLLFGVPAATWALNHWLPLELSAFITRVGAVLGAVAAAVRWPLRAASGAIDQLERAREKASDLMEQRKRDNNAQEVSLEKEVNELRAKEASATQQLTAADAKIQAIQSKIEEIDEGRSLAKYLLQRFQAEDYRKYLGLVSTIRRDFEKLSQLLRSTEKEPIRRIILYIDDLDRCPAPRVMEVLQAVHLLLAFELFVVVVGVDPRWLLHSLEKSYTAFQKKGHGQAQNWITTPQNYLEKIFQIPFSVRAMDADGFSRLMRSLLPVRAESVGVISQTASTPEPATPAQAPQAAMAAGAAAGSLGQPAPLAKAVSADVPVTQAAGSTTPPEPPSLDYDALLIQRWEAEFAEQLFAFMPSPRAAKRFSNTYRLLKAPLSGERLKKFEGIDASTGDFRAAMVLLAVLTGFPDSAPAVFTKVLEEGGNGLPAAALFGDAEKCKVSPADRERFKKCFTPFLNGGLPDGLDIFTEWLPKVARFSFATSKIGQ